MADRPFDGLIPKVVDSHMVQEDAKRKPNLVLEIESARRFFDAKELEPPSRRAEPFKEFRRTQF
jgi:hypothetical protein